MYIKKNIIIILIGIFLVELLWRLRIPGEAIEQGGAFIRGAALMILGRIVAETAIFGIIITLLYKLYLSMRKHPGEKNVSEFAYDKSYIYVQKETLTIFVGVFAILALLNIVNIFESLCDGTIISTCGIIITLTIVYGIIITLIYKIARRIWKRIKLK